MLDRMREAEAHKIEITDRLLEAGSHKRAMSEQLEAAAMRSDRLSLIRVRYFG